MRFLADALEPELEVTRTRGSFLFDANGKRYIDFVMGWCVGNFGWRNAALTKPIERFRGPDYVYPGFSYKRWEELARLLSSIAPGTLTTSFRATGGSEAVDIALQAAMVHTGRKKFLSIEDSYHGNTIAGLSVGASENRETFANLLSGCSKIAPPLDLNALDKVETRLKRRDVAAFIMEPISINLGVLIPETEFVTGLQRLCRRYGTLLIMDEVATGFGRTGAVFATEHFGIEPDILCVGKAITGGVSDMGAAIATREVAQSMEADGSFYSTYGWHPRSTEAAIATVRYMIRHRKRLAAHIAAIGKYFSDRLARMRFTRVTRVKAIRMKGLAIGIDVGKEDEADALQAKCRRQGLLTSTEGSTLLLLPALEIPQRVAKAGLDILEKCVE